MTENQKSVFSQKAFDKMRSPDDLDKALSVAAPGLWAVILACAVLVAGLVVWGVFGTVISSVTTQGVRTGDQLLCLLTSEEASYVEEGEPANVAGRRMSVSSVSTIPISHEEARELLGSDYLADTLMKEKWAYVVLFDGDPSAFTEGALMKVHITTDRVSPVELVLGGVR